MIEVTYRVRKIESSKIIDTNLENWFNYHVWSSVFDHVFGNIINIIAVIKYFSFFFLKEYLFDLMYFFLLIIKREKMNQMV